MILEFLVSDSDIDILSTQGATEEAENTGASTINSTENFNNDAETDEPTLTTDLSCNYDNTGDEAATQVFDCEPFENKGAVSVLLLSPKLF